MLSKRTEKNLHVGNGNSMSCIQKLNCDFIHSIDFHHSFMI